MRPTFIFTWKYPPIGSALPSTISAADVLTGAEACSQFTGHIMERWLESVQESLAVYRHRWDACPVGYPDLPPALPGRKVSGIFSL